MGNDGGPLWSKYLRSSSDTGSDFPLAAKIWHVPAGRERLRPPQNADMDCPLPFDWESRPYAAFDVETTGLDPVNDRIVELGLVNFSLDSEGAARVESEWSSLVNPGVPIPAQASAIHGIFDLEVSGAMKFADLLGTLQDFLRGRVIVAHNAVFDISFLRSETARIRTEESPMEWVDSLGLARLAYPQLTSYNLGRAAFALGIESGDSHRALGDARTCMRLFLRCARRVAGSCP